MTRWHLILALWIAALVAAVGWGVQTVDAAHSVGGPLSPCPGSTPFNEEYRWTNGIVHRGCATGYSTGENLDGGGGVYCNGRLDDDRLTTAVSINVPILNYPGSRRVRCGLRVKVCGTRCVVVLVNDRGPYKLGSDEGGDYGRDFDLSRAARRAIGVNVALRSWGDPVIVWWKVCGAQTPVGASRCSPERPRRRPRRDRRAARQEARPHRGGEPERPPASLRVPGDAGGPS